MTASVDAARDRAVAAFLRCIDQGDFFDAHEVLEAFWVTYQGSDRDFYKGLIQSAVALHHASRGNAVGARGVAARSRAAIAPYGPRHADVDVEAILDRLAPL